ncbi:hypothetical protein GGI20_001826 [Coemansia sp. BCRC 34301]|nr:hypothetical protein GGI20_001826 [Coemansia sp. BCRC 34301]
MRRQASKKKRKGKRLAAGADDVDDENTFEVEAIVGDAEIDGVHLFEVKWKGYGPEENQWLPMAHMGCPSILANYLQTRERRTADLTEFYRLLMDAQGPTISVVNTVDDVGCPKDFKYINKVIYSDEVPRPCAPLFLCECTNGCRSDCECAGECSYDENGLLKTQHIARIVECGPLCKCGDSCVNRVVQKGSSVLFEIRRFARKGWGVVAKQDLRQGTFVAEYIGEVISYDEAESRGLTENLQGLTYLFDLDRQFTGDVSDFSIDAKNYGNISHFFNHACTPNMVVHAVYIEHRDPRLHRLAFFTTRKVCAGEELTFDYAPAAVIGKGLQTITCHCGTDNCRKYMYY